MGQRTASDAHTQSDFAGGTSARHNWRYGEACEIKGKCGSDESADRIMCL